MTKRFDDLHSLRNIGIIAHIDAGKTTTTERILYYCGKEHRIGEVDEGTAHMDWMKEEQERGITITSAVTTVIWKKYKINLIDTPGHVDFTCEVERALRTLDGAVGIFDGVAGVEAQSETVWRQADYYNIPRLAFINKLDKTGADFEAAVKSLVDRLHVKPVVMCFPVGSESSLSGVVDVLSGVVLRFSEEHYGKKVTEEPVPEALQETLTAYREKLYEAACEYSEELLEQYLEGEPLKRETVLDAVRTGVLNGDITPVYCGASFRNKGVQPLLDGICAFLPSPLDRGAVSCVHPKTGKKITRKPSVDEPFAALAFKVRMEKHGEVIYSRIYSGKVRQGAQVLISNLGKKERIGKIYLMDADEKVEESTAFAGDIVAFRGLKLVSTGHTICDPKAPAVLEGMHFPDTVVAQAIEPKNYAERDKMLDSLKLLAREDPTFTWNLDDDTGQVIIKGMGELHLEVVVHRLLEEWKIQARVGEPRVWYRQTIQKTSGGESRFEREIGNKNHFAAVEVEVSPSDDVVVPEIDVELDHETVGREFWPVIVEGVKNGVESGGYLGFPWINMRVRVVGGESRIGESTPVAFTAAAQQAFEDAVEKAGRVLLEPVMRFDVFVPLEFYGPVSADLTKRRGEIKKTNIQLNGQRIEGTIPLSQTFGYMNMLRSLTQGRGALTLEPSGFAPVTEDVTRKFDF